MAEKILKAILYSCESANKNLENSKEYNKLLEENKFLPSNDILNALCLSLTKLLTYKVSKEAYQRYTVRLHVIVGILYLKVYTKSLSYYFIIYCYFRKFYENGVKSMTIFKISKYSEMKSKA